MTLLHRAQDLLFELTLLLLPWIGVGSVLLLTGRPLGMGIQPAVVSGLLVLVLLSASRWGGRIDSRGWAVLAALVWTVLGTITVWRLDQIGLAGEAPWSKSIKQLAVLVLFVGLAVVPSVLLSRAPEPRRRLEGWERAASAGLLAAATLGILQAVGFYRELPGLERVLGWVTSNPSIASGSEELYLGHRFVGIPRVSGPACEPLYFGSYLLVTVPVALARAGRLRGFARAWRLVAGAAGALCLVLTFSRGVYLGAAVLAAVLGWGGWRGRLGRTNVRRIAWTTAVAIAGLLVAAAPLTGTAPWAIPGLLVRRLAQSFQPQDMSNLTRLYAWKAAWGAFAHAPVTGIGWGGFGFWYYTLSPEGAGAHFGWPVTNSLPLRFLAETGIVGAWLWIAAARPAFAGLRSLPGTSPEGDALSFFVSTLCLAALAQTLTFSQLQLPHLWLLLGVSAAVAQEQFRMV